MSPSEYLPASLATNAGFEEYCVEAMERLPDDYQTDSDEHLNVLVPLLLRRFGSRSRLNVVELGPRGTTIVAHTLAPYRQRYLGVEYSPACVKRQNELFQVQKVADAEAVFGNTYALEIPDNSQDVVIAACHDPLVSGRPAWLLRAYSEVARILKPDGELVLLPFDEANYRGPPTKGGTSSFNPLHHAAAPFTHFRAVEMVLSPALYAPPRMLVALVKNEVGLEAMTWDLQLEFYEEAERLSRAAVEQWLLTAPFTPANESVRECLESWKRHALNRTVLYQGGCRTRVSRIDGIGTVRCCNEDT